MTRTTTFNWTNLRHLDLVGWDGEDLDLPGVKNEGNLVHIQVAVVGLQQVKEGEDADTIDIYGQRWVLPLR
jgi:hypothetical protein